MKNYFTLMLTLMLSLHGSKVYAYDIAVKNADGVTIYYDYLYGETELAVTNGNSSSYSGDINIPEVVAYNSKTLKVTSIGKYAFAYCHLTSITMPKSITIIEEHAFYKAEDITSIDIPNGVKSIEIDAFCNIETLLSVNIPNSVKSIGDGAFRNCSRLVSIAFSANLLSIGAAAFTDCESLKTIILPNKVRSVGNSAFHQCTNLTELTLPNSMTSIGNNAFDRCNLTKITSLIEKPFDIIGTTYSNKTFSEKTYNNATLYVPDGTIERYKNTIGWKEFTNIIEKTLVKKISIDKREVSLKVGEKDTLHAQILPETAFDKTIKWSSSNEQIANVDDNGLVTAIKAGEVWIKVTAISNPEAEDSCKITVIQPVTGISLSQENYTLDRIGASYQLKAIIEPENASNKEVTWKSYNESVCIVNNGLVIATGYGSTIVTSTTIDGGFMAYCTITVEDNTPVKNVDAETSGYKVFNLQGFEQKQLRKGINIIHFKDGTKKKVLIK